MSLEDKKKGSQYIDKNTTEDLYFGSDVREAVQSILKKIRVLPNRDDKIDIRGTRLCILDGGGIGRFEAIRIIEEETGFKEQEEAKKE